MAQVPAATASSRRNNWLCSDVCILQCHLVVYRTFVWKGSHRLRSSVHCASRIRRFEGNPAPEIARHFQHLVQQAGCRPGVLHWSTGRVAAWGRRQNGEGGISIANTTADSLSSVGRPECTIGNGVRMLAKSRGICAWIIMC